MVASKYFYFKINRCIIYNLYDPMEKGHECSDNPKICMLRYDFNYTSTVHYVTHKSLINTYKSMIYQIIS